MPKKQRRQVSGGSAVAKTAPTYTPASSARRLTPTAEFNPDYTHVKSDLKRIGVLAGSILTIMIVLSFILH